MEARKQAVSIRLNTADLRNLRKLSRRLGVRYSDMIRFAIRTTLARLGPLNEADSHGRSLVPVFVEAGADMVRYLDLDAADMETIINEGAVEDERVDRADIQLLALAGVQQPYARLRLVSMGNVRASGAPAVEMESAGEDRMLTQSLRRYLYDKYVFEAAPGYPSAHNGVAQENGALKAGGSSS
jgi:hypothetical protein